MIDSRTISEVTGLAAPESAAFERLGWASSALPGTLSFVEGPDYVAQVLANPNVTGVFAPPSLAASIRASDRPIEVLACEDPRWAYHVLYNHVALRDYAKRPNEIAADAEIHPSAHVAEHNVTIGARTIVAANVTILADVQIGADCVIQPGTVIGSVGFELKRTSRGVLSVVHDGVVEIGDRVEIGANTCIDKGFSGNPTLIEDDARVDNLVHVAHGVKVRRGAFVVAGTVLGGSCEVGEDAWLSINASVAPGLKLGDRSFVSIGGVVTRNVDADQQVTGNLALPHALFLKIFKRLIRDAGES